MMSRLPVMSQCLLSCGNGPRFFAAAQRRCGGPRACPPSAAQSRLLRRGCRPGLAGSSACCRAAALTRTLPSGAVSMAWGNSSRSNSSLCAAGLGALRMGWLGMWERCLAGVFQAGGLVCAALKASGGSNQFSTRRPSTRSNSRVLRVTRVSWWAKAMPAISVSMLPMGYPGVPTVLAREPLARRWLRRRRARESVAAPPSAC